MSSTKYLRRISIFLIYLQRHLNVNICILGIKQTIFFYLKCFLLKIFKVNLKALENEMHLKEINKILLQLESYLNADISHLISIILEIGQNRLQSLGS